MSSFYLEGGKNILEIQDFGEKIGGAKKDLWKERGLSIADLVGMNDAEKIKLIKKDNVWKRPNYQEMVDNGMPVRVAYFIKLIRDAIPTKPIITYRDRTPELIMNKQEGYVEFVGKIRDYAMNLSKEDEIFNFYNDFLSKYVTFNNPYSVLNSSEAYDYINQKMLNLLNIKNFLRIDNEIIKNQFCFTDEEKILSKFEIFYYSKDNTKFTKYNDRNTIEHKERFVKYYIYPKEQFSNPDNWKENTFFIWKNGEIIKNNLNSIDDAKKYILDNYEVSPKVNTRNRKKKFIPKQLKNISRDGEDVRNGKDITGEDMLKSFIFKGGEFGNWLNDNDRHQSLNYGFEALMDLSKALAISPEDISLGNRLSIAFGSRGSGSALAHYEPDREVINITKMRGAGSLAHEWGHALDDIVGKKLGLNGFLTERYNSTDPILKEMKDIIETMQYKTVCNKETTKLQREEYEKEINKAKKYIDSFFPEKYLTENQKSQKESLVQKLIDNSETSSNNLIDYISKGIGNKEIDELSKLRSETVGKVIPKIERINLAYLQNNINIKEKNIGSSQKIKTDFYKNSIKFDDYFSKTDNGYWQSKAEMFARAFACYVYDKLGYKSDYLCGHANKVINSVINDKGETEVIKAFPIGEERKAINEKIDTFIKVLKEKEILHDYNENVNIYDEKKESENEIIL